jgi:hypothetical protein
MSDYIDERGTVNSSNLRYRYSAVHTSRDDNASISSTSFRPMPKEARLYYKLKASAVFATSIYILHAANAYRTVLHSSKLNHAAFRVGLACSVAILSVKSYVELFEGKLQKKTVDYKNFRQTTHLILALLMVAGISFHVALWPVYGAWKTIGIMLCFVYGVLLTFCIVFPTWVQNLVGFILCTYVLQEYL